MHCRYKKPWELKKSMESATLDGSLAIKLSKAMRPVVLGLTICVDTFRAGSFPYLSSTLLPANDFEEQAPYRLSLRPLPINHF